MTKREYFEGIKELVKDNETYVTFLDAEIERIDKRGHTMEADHPSAPVVFDIATTSNVASMQIFPVSFDFIT